LSDQIVIGVDGGGTCTRVALATSDGRLIGMGASGAGNYHDVGAAQIRSNLEEALSLAWQDTEMPRLQASAAFLGLGSIVSEEDREVIRRVARDLSLAPASKVGVHHDLSVAIAGGLLGQPGIVLIAGTGSSCYGQDGDGRTWQAGGWGPTVDDLGSGHWLGLQAMIAAVREYDRRQKPTILSARVLEALHIDVLPQIMRRVEIEGITRNEIALLAPLVTEAAGSGDEVAQMILAEGVQELALLVATVCRELNLVEFLETVPVAVTGGMTKAGPVFFDALRSAVRQNCSACELVQPKCQPVFGALLKAIELLGVAPTTEILDNLVMSQSVN